MAQVPAEKVCGSLQKRVQSNCLLYCESKLTSRGLAQRTRPWQAESCIRHAVTTSTVILSQFLPAEKHATAFQEIPMATQNKSSVQNSYSGFRVDGTIPKKWFIWTPI